MSFITTNKKNLINLFSINEQKALMKEKKSFRFCNGIRTAKKKAFFLGLLDNNILPRSLN